MHDGTNAVNRIRSARVGSTGKQFVAWAFVALAFLLGVSCIVPGALYGDRRATEEARQATATAEAMLTERYGEEVRKVIEHFEMQWHSLEAHVNPDVQKEIATGPFLRCYGNEKYDETIYDEPFWFVITSAEVINVRVLEYSPERFKVVASVAREMDKITPDGTLLQPSLPAGLCGIYVFVRENGVWKLSAFFLTDPPRDDVIRDWHDSPEWLKEIVGELPEGNLCDWK